MNSIESLLSDISILDEFHAMEPFWDLLAQQWMESEHPNHEMKDDFWFFCDLDSKGTYALYQDLDDKPGFMNPDGNIMKAGYLIKDGKCWLIGNEHHQYAWWIADDWIWNMLLWEIDSSGKEKCEIPPGCIGYMDPEGIWQIAPEGAQKELNLSCWQSAPAEMEELCEKALLNMGFEKSGEQIDLLEKCLNQ